VLLNVLCMFRSFCNLYAMSNVLVDARVVADKVSISVKPVSYTG
jgi:hypothetical protein